MAPLVGTHLPYRNGITAKSVAASTNPIPNAYAPAEPRPPRKRSTTAIATTVTEPPSHIGVPAQ